MPNRRKTYSLSCRRQQGIRTRSRDRPNTPPISASVFPLRRPCSFILSDFLGRDAAYSAASGYFLSYILSGRLIILPSLSISSSNGTKKASSFKQSGSKSSSSSMPRPKGADSKLCRITSFIELCSSGISDRFSIRDGPAFNSSRQLLSSSSTHKGNISSKRSFSFIFNFFVILLTMYWQAFRLTVLTFSGSAFCLRGTGKRLTFFFTLRISITLFLPILRISRSSASSILISWE